MKKHPLLTAAAAAGTAVLGAAYGIYRVAFYQKPTTVVPSPADMPTREVYRKAMCPDADALARDTFTPVHITAQDGTPLAARYYHHTDGAPLAIIFHGYRGYAVRDGDFDLDTITFGAPLLDKSGNAWAVLVMSAPRSRVDDIVKERYLFQVRETANQISRELGFSS